ncbi:MAG: carboxylesterase family protein [Lachnospiraceae bacterium]|nr:carboxylesterase family protein [Lachnospiraceae bacterium]
MYLRQTKTENGEVRGFPGIDARITVYKGIPFADDTGYENRWKAPQPAKDWEGVRDCYEFGPIPMQRIPGRDPNAFYAKEWHVDPEVPMGEDCLRANIWTPAHTADEKLPVMVWIFGGGLSEGYPHEMEFDGERIASRGVILVSIGYRLNVFGELCHPELTASQPEAPSNFCFLDQAYGITWVKRNIANFGGDPENITIFGQSAGGASVLTHMCAEQAEGLFQKCIIESFNPLNPSIPPTRFSFKPTPFTDKEAMGIKFFEEFLGVKTLEEARKLDAQFIMDKYTESKLFFNNIVDPYYLDVPVLDCLLANKFHDVQFMLGNTVDEFTEGPDCDDEEGIMKWIDEHYGEYAEGFKELVRKSDKPLKEAATISRVAVGNDILVTELAKMGRKFYFYNFDPEIPGDNAGSFHSSDLWFQFETLARCWRPFDGHHYDLARKMCNYWTNFAKTGNPNGNDADGTPMPEWKPVTPEAPFPIRLYDEITMGDDFRSDIEKYVYDIWYKENNK